jgi:hypothetical protein
MSSRSLRLATILFLIGAGGADIAFAQAQNLEAGKTPSQIFAQTCTACHKSARGLLKTVAPGSLPGFLRQHYTTSSDMAGVLASYLISNGAADTRYGAGEPKGGARGGRDGREAARQKEANTSAAQETPEHSGRRMRPSQEAARPDGEGGRPAEGQAATERGPEGRKGKRMSRRGKPGPEAAPKADTPRNMPAAGESPAEDKQKGGAAKLDEAKPSADKSSGEIKPETAAKPETVNPEPAKPEASKPEASKPEAATPEARSEAAKPDAGPSQSARSEPARSDVPAPPPASRPAEPPTTGAPEPSPAK